MLVDASPYVPGRCYSFEQRPQMMYVRDNFGPHRTSSAQAEWATIGYYG